MLKVGQANSEGMLPDRADPEAFLTGSKMNPATNFCVCQIEIPKCKGIRSDKNNRSRALSARGALCVVLVMGLGLMARQAVAEPFAYVANDGANNVSVIDTATNTVA